MELSFVIEAARRYAWLIVVCAVLGALPGFVTQQSAETSFESRAVLLVVPARDARVQIAVTGENERYVLGQLAVLRSDALATMVAGRIGGGMTVAGVKSSIDFRHADDTDIVEIVASSSVPDRARIIADEYADGYLQLLADQLDPEGSPEIEELDRQLVDLSRRIADIDDEISVAMAPFLAAVTAPASELTTLPTIEQVAPGLVSERQLVTADYLGRLEARNGLALGSQLSVSTEIIEGATTPLQPIGQQRVLLIAAGILGGSLVGLFLAALLARLTPRLLSLRHAGETLGGQQVLGPMRWKTRDDGGLLGIDIALEREQQDVLTTIRSSLMVAARDDRSMIILVAGSTPGSGSEHVAASIASLWASDGYLTVLVDADLRHQAVTSTISTDTTLTFDGEGAFSVDHELVDTAVPGLLLLPAKAAGTASRRERIELLLSDVESVADVVVFDVGSLLASTFALRLAGSADGVVLAIGPDTRASALSLAARQLAGQRDRLTAVWTEPASQRLRRQLTGATSRTSPSRPEHDAEELDTDALESVD